MVYTYQELEEMKKSGVHLNWEDITKKQLEKLFIDENINSGLIASLYDVNRERVRSKRRKWHISIYSPKYLYKRYIEENNIEGLISLFTMLNQNSKEILLNEENKDFIFKAFTNYVFQNSPVEDMYVAGILSKEDMEIINQYIVNRMIGLIKLMQEGQWQKIELLCNALCNFETKMDKVEMDTKEIDLKEQIRARRL